MVAAAAPPRPVSVRYVLVATPANSNVVPGEKRPKAFDAGRRDAGCAAPTGEKSGCDGPAPAGDSGGGTIVGIGPAALGDGGIDGAVWSVLAEPTDAASSAAERGLGAAGDGWPFFLRTTRQSSASPPRLKNGCSNATPASSPRLIFLNAYMFMSRVNDVHLQCR